MSPRLVNRSFAGNPINLRRRPGQVRAVRARRCAELTVANAAATRSTRREPTVKSAATLDHTGRADRWLYFLAAWDTMLGVRSGPLQVPFGSVDPTCFHSILSSQVCRVGDVVSSAGDSWRCSRAA